MFERLTGNLKVREFGKMGKFRNSKTWKFEHLRSLTVRKFEGLLTLCQRNASVSFRLQQEEKEGG